jgi:ATP-dependent DNA helicase RecG
MSLNAKLSDHLRIMDKQRIALKRLGITTIGDLLYHFPVRYSNMSTVSSIAHASGDDVVTLYGVINNPRIKKTFHGGVPTAEARLTDLEGNSIKVVWFNQAFIAKALKDGEIVKLSGKISEGKYGKTLTNPEFEKLTTLPIDTGDSLFTKDEGSDQYFGFPIYRESRGVSSKWIYHSIIKILSSGILENLDDPLPIHLRETYNLPSRGTSLVWIHSPRSQANADSAKKRFAFEEIFFIQLRNQQRRYQHQQNFSYQLEVDPLSIKKFIERFPFTPTDAQTSAVESILFDMASDKPMSRLLEGDVGSGKTFVAAVAAYATIMNRPRKKSDSSYDFGRLQVAYMAPTEVLANQLFENFIEYFEGTGIQIALLTGSGCKKFPSKVPGETWTTISKTQVSKWIKNGEIPIVIGTHSLIQKNVEFQDLALAIVDEQHRFGTQQRMKLGSKDHRIPHFLSMTATPIPRTLALTIYGDLDLSVVDSMPTGRKQVITEVVSPDLDSRARVYNSIIASLNEGRQAYVICPRINEPDPNKQTALNVASVKAETARLKEKVFPNWNIAMLHSKMKPDEKDKIMKQFEDHEIDVLVSTSVIEVGVNVPNATTIIIEGAERFGLSQLHQLRGRVLRSSHQAYAYLFSDSKTETSIERLKALQSAKNGFELSEFDLQFRGSGELYGKKQWGITDLGMEAIKNIKMVEFARKEAQQLLKKDPELDKHTSLQKFLEQKGEVHFE